jgi:hypothetical protein
MDRDELLDRLHEAVSELNDVQLAAVVKYAASLTPSESQQIKQSV